jgi:glycosyltransferase involved in cell wall biosynthesis
MTLKNKPIVIIGIPAYNCINYIEQCVNSCLLQTYKGSLRILIQDDFSDDGTWELLKLKYTDNPKIYLFRNEKNMGMCRNWNNLFGKTKIIGCDYFLKLDGDDWIDNNMVEQGVDKLIQYPDINAVTFSLKYFIQENENIQSRIIENEISEGLVNDILSLIYFKNPFSLVATLFRMETLISLQTVHSNSLFLETEVGDFELFLRFSFHNKKMFFSKKATAYYRKHLTNSSNKPNKQLVSLYIDVMPFIHSSLCKYLKKNYKKRVHTDLFNYIKGVIRFRNPVDFNLLFSLIKYSI